MRGLRGVNLQNAYGTPFWSGPRGRGLGGDTTVLDPSIIGPIDPSTTITNPGNYYPGLSPASGGPPSWLPAVQTGVQDVFQFAKLFNPIPPGTVMQSGPGGTYIARASNGQATPGFFPSVGGSGFGWGTMLLIGGVIALLVFAREAR